MRPRDDLTGQRFGRLIVVKYAGKNHSNHSFWSCKCDCGAEKVIAAYHLRRGDAQSCGCLAKERLSQTHTTHGETNTRLFNIWTGMKARCELKSHTSYDRYGARGISVCDEWKNSYVSFRDWAKANGYADHLTIDRIDSSGNYEPSNCRWVTYKEQAQNRNYKKR